MKRVEAVLATTCLDSQGERMTRGALDCLAETISRTYLPVGIEHDPRIPPQGRISTGFVRKRPDGEFEVVAVMEIFDDSDEPPSPEDLREIVLHTIRSDGLTISYDWTHRSKEDQADIAAIADILGTKPVYEGKKAADPISIISLTGAFLLGGIAAGFLGQIGVDGWNLIKERIRRLFDRKNNNRRGEQLLVFRALLDVNGVQVEIEAVLTSPNQQELDTFLASGLEILDRVVPIYLRNSPDVRRLVFEANGSNLKLEFAIRKDCRPLVPSIQVQDILKKGRNES